MNTGRSAKYWLGMHDVLIGEMKLFLEKRGWETTNLGHSLGAIWHKSNEHSELSTHSVIEAVVLEAAYE